MILLLWACTEPTVVPSEPEHEVRPWTVAVFMDGDNDLEEWVTHDLNELEAGDAGTNAWVVVQADRIDGYDTSDGDWTDARRYAISHDTTDTVTSEVVAEIGEVDMGDPEVLSDFLEWTADNYPSERTMVVLWDHGDSWTIREDSASGIAYDETSETMIGVANGGLTDGLQAFVDTTGPIDLLAFDGCNMGAYEVAYALRDHAATLSLSQSWVGWEGMQYTPLLDALGTDPDVATRVLADLTAIDAIDGGGERTWSAIDTAGIAAVHAALDGLATAFLTEEDGVDTFVNLRRNARSTEIMYRTWYTDVGDLAAVSAAHPVYTDAGEALATAMGGAVISAYGDERFTWTSGLSVFAASEDPKWVELYQEGPWAEGSQWDDLLVATGAVEVVW